MTEGDDGPLGLGEQRVFGSFRAVAAGNRAEGLAAYFEKPVRVLGKERFFCSWDGEGVAAEDELAP